MAVTYRQAKKLLQPGDVVYTTNGKVLLLARVDRIFADSLMTDVDVLFFEDHGNLWWLTESVAKERVYGTS